MADAGSLDTTVDTSTPAPAGSLDTTVAQTSAPVGAPTKYSTPYANDIASMETGGNNDATNPLYPVEKGGPLGPHQFLASTWQGFANANRDLFHGMTQDQIMNARRDPVISAKATEWLAGQNGKVLQQHGIAATPQNLGVAHAFGGAGASGILRYPDDARMPDVLKATQPGMADEILRLNPQYANMTVGQVRQKYAGLGTTIATPATTGAAPAVPAIAPAPATPSSNGLAQLQRVQQYQQLAALNQLIQANTPKQSSGPNANIYNPGGDTAAILQAGNINGGNAGQQSPMQNLMMLARLRNPLLGVG